jgi:hypothetical protein
MKRRRQDWQMKLELKGKKMRKYNGKDRKN